MGAKKETVDLTGKDKEKVRPSYNITDGRFPPLEKTEGEIADVQEVTYLSLQRNTMVFLDENRYIQFQNHRFTTSNPEIIEFLDNSGLVGEFIWKEKFPDWVIQKFKKDQEMLTYNIDDFRVGEL
jgi:hypothetical protein